MILVAGGAGDAANAGEAVGVISDDNSNSIQVSALPYTISDSPSMIRHNNKILICGGTGDNLKKCMQWSSGL